MYKHFKHMHTPPPHTHTRHLAYSNTDTWAYSIMLTHVLFLTHSTSSHTNTHPLSPTSAQKHIHCLKCLSNIKTSHFHTWKRAKYQLTNTLNCVDSIVVVTATAQDCNTRFVNVFPQRWVCKVSVFNLHISRYRNTQALAQKEYIKW